MFRSNEVTLKIAISDEYVERALFYLENIRDSQFALGDLLVELTDMHGGYKSGVINYLAGKTGMAASTLYDYEAVARRWTPEYRLQYPKLDFTVYRVCDPITDKEILERAVDENLSATKVKELVYPGLIEPTKLIRNALYSLNKVNLNGDARLIEVLKLLEALLTDLCL